MTEQWRPIAGYEGRYDVSNLGRVRSLRLMHGCTDRLRDDPKILAPGLRSDYPSVSLARDGKTKSFFVHSLVAHAFLGERPEGQIIRHLDGVKAHCSADNLAYGTYSDNEADKGVHGSKVNGERVNGAKLTPVDVLEIRAIYVAGSRTLGAKPLARRYGVNNATITRVATGRAWKHVREIKCGPLFAETPKGDA